MIRSTVIGAAFFAAILIAGLWPHETAASMDQDPGTKQKLVTLTELLADMGRAYNYYFTIESAWLEGEPQNNMEALLMNPPPEHKGLHISLQAMQRAIPNFTYISNPADGRIVHVIDSRLLKQEGYGLAQTIKNVDFSGLLVELPKYINQQGVAVSPFRGGSIRDISIADFSTTVQIKGQDLPVRTILSNYFPLEERNPILWIARTKLGKGELTDVLFRMRKRKGMGDIERPTVKSRSN